MNSFNAGRKSVVHHIRNIQAVADSSSYERAAFTLQNKLLRVLWNTIWLLLYRTSPRPLHQWRAYLLRMFGAKMGPHCHFYPSGKIWAPWNLTCEDHCTLADDAEIYNPSHLYMESHAIISQHAYVCGATHDYDDPDFPMISYPMKLGAYSWICSRASVAPGVTVGAGAVLGLGSVANTNLEPWMIYSGVPAIKMKARKQHVAHLANEQQ